MSDSTETPAAGPDRLGFESLSVGQTGRLGEMVAERDAMVDFATMWDPQPFHLDEAAGAASPLGGLAASGWHTASMTMRLLVDGLLTGLKSMGSGQVTDLRWLKPVLVGDRLVADYEIRGIRPSSRGDRGYVDAGFVVTNQRGETVMTMAALLLIGK